MSKLVSIIIPTYNRANLIKETLNSIIQQTYTNWECIVVDDGSTDFTAAVVNAYTEQDPRFKYYKRPQENPKGAGSCRNYGVEVSKGDYINFFDSDDIMLPTKLEVQLNQLLESNKVLSVCLSQVFEGDQSNIIGMRNHQTYSTDFFNDFIQKKIKWLTPEPIIQKEFLINNNIKWHEYLPESDDRDYMLKIFSSIKTYDYIDEPLVLIRRHQNNVSSTPTAEKVLSDFKVSYETVINYRSNLNTESLAFMKKRMQLTYRKSLRLKFNKVAFTMAFKLMKNELDLSFKEKMKMMTAFVTFVMCNKGEVLFK